MTERPGQTKPCHVRRLMRQFMPFYGFAGNNGSGPTLAHQPLHADVTPQERYQIWAKEVSIAQRELERTNMERVKFKEAEAVFYGKKDEAGD
ncbi:hypothetical protein A2115_02145 [Candidatus Woesebacteria bacterium GWA1_41_8]|uniref:Uncharacterized protein n=1 Tax=Candidatus Woesebacteria bacterium GWA1_41_8 TaxID=1802471 RepID=A0A1F7WIR8_9BACT|nr:MAG: hypothetical protein A2115_02145 [Candidatus Woesebacteria bacterium GWA1_41_8]